LKKCFYTAVFVVVVPYNVFEFSDTLSGVFRKHTKALCLSSVTTNQT